MHEETETSSVLTVSQLTQMIKLQLEANFPRLSIKGEISNFKRQSSGHLYFSLKDEGAHLSAVMFRNAAQKLTDLPKNGDSVIAKGSLNLYPPHGKYQLVVQEMSLAGVGELLLRLEQLKKKLHKQGYFRKEHKQPLPRDPRHIGIVTSPTGAAVRDILQVLTRRQAGLRISLYPVNVQGEGAATEIATAIQQLNACNLCDVIIVGRGGGSVEDLWAFNEEVVAQAIFDSRIPIIGAVGHETDHCIAEYVADVRAPTPSAAAEIVTQERGQQRQQLLALASHLRRTTLHLIAREQARLEGLLRHPLFQRSDALLAPWLQRCDELREGLDTSIQQLLLRHRMQLQALSRQQKAFNPLARLAVQQRQLEQITQGINHATRHLLRRHQERLTYLRQGLASIDPSNLLEKGYSIIFSQKDGSVISSLRHLESGRNLRLRLADGEAEATVTKVLPS